jgi:hypothetical protein
VLAVDGHDVLAEEEGVTAVLHAHGQRLRLVGWAEPDLLDAANRSVGRFDDEVPGAVEPVGIDSGGHHRLDTPQGCRVTLPSNAT